LQTWRTVLGDTIGLTTAKLIEAPRRQRYPGRSRSFTPTAEHRRLVSCLASMNVNHEAIFQLLVRDHGVPCSSPT
jgi:hypothetical protein